MNMQKLTFGLCTVRDFDGECYPRTLSPDNIIISPNIKWPYTWVKVEIAGDYAGVNNDIFCIYIDEQWHQAQSIDFNF